MAKEETVEVHPPPLLHHVKPTNSARPGHEKLVHTIAPLLHASIARGHTEVATRL